MAVSLSSACTKKQQDLTSDLSSGHCPLDYRAQTRECVSLKPFMRCVKNACKPRQIIHSEYGRGCEQPVGEHRLGPPVCAPLSSPAPSAILTGPGPNVSPCSCPAPTQREARRPEGTWNVARVLPVVLTSLQSGAPQMTTWEQDDRGDTRAPLRASCSYQQDVWDLTPATKFLGLLCLSVDLAGIT